MANRPYKNVKRFVDNISKEVKDTMEGGNGGIILVDTLPEVGKEDTLYKTPDGKIWSCTNTTETETICDLEVGKSFKLKNEILAGDIVSLCDIFGEGDFDLSIDEDYFLYTSKNIPEYDPANPSPTVYFFGYEASEGGKFVDFNATGILPTELVTAELEGFTEIPSVEITQLLVDNLTNFDLELLDIDFAFVDGSHTEEVTTSTWTEVGSSGGSSNNLFINFEYTPGEDVEWICKISRDNYAKFFTDLINHSFNGSVIFTFKRDYMGEPIYDTIKTLQLASIQVSEEYNSANVWLTDALHEDGSSGYYLQEMGWIRYSGNLNYQKDEDSYPHIDLWFRAWQTQDYNRIIFSIDNDNIIFE